MKWIPAWSYRPVDYGTAIGTVEDITQRSYFWNNVSGDKVKIRFSNLYSKQELNLEKVVIGQQKPGKQHVEEVKVVTYHGKEQIHLCAGEEGYSDILEWNIEAGTQIVLSVYLKEKTQVWSACSTWAAKSWRTRYGCNGDFTLEQEFEELECREIYPYVEADCNKSNVIVGISEISIETEDTVKNITMFGDSITHMSYYSDPLLEGLLESYRGAATVVNRGIGGNRILHDATYLPDADGHGKCFGIAGIKRYQADLFEHNTPDAVLVLEGINDIMHPYQFEHKDEIVSVLELIDAVEEMVEACHKHGAKVYLGTIMPFKMEQVDWLFEAETVRNQFNEWVRTQDIADGVMDFDCALRGTEDVQALQKALHIGDGLHPNIEGGKKMASLVPVADIVEV